jgi:hypothetical protein
MSAFGSVESNERHGQQLLNDVVSLFLDLLAAGGATSSMVDQAISSAKVGRVPVNSSTVFTELGNLQRDCMEVMCTWRRDTSLLDNAGVPVPLSLDNGPRSFSELCKRARCKHDSNAVLKALRDFGAVSISTNGTVVSNTPTFLLGRASDVGLLATDGLLKQLEGYLGVVHRNVRSVRGEHPARFERACTVSVAVELEPIFDQLVRERGQVFVDSVDEWLERHRNHPSPSRVYRELGAGVYYIDLGVRPEDRNDS